jgi:predicted acetyltransferase
VHVRAAGRANQRYALLFRDYLRADLSAALAYQAAKRALAALHPEEIDAYLAVKDPICDLIIAAAERWAARAPAAVTLVAVDADDARLDRLLQLYMAEWTALLPRPIGADARFAYPGLAAYRDRARHAAYLFVEAGLPAGFALVACDAAGAWHVQELFVLPGLRGRGVGLAAARALLATRAATWTWTVRPENPAALAFWRRLAPDAEVAIEVGADGVARTRFTRPSG